MEESCLPHTAGWHVRVLTFPLVPLAAGGTSLTLQSRTGRDCGVLIVRAGQARSLPGSAGARLYSRTVRQGNTPRHPATAAPDSFPLDSAPHISPALHL